MYSTRFWYSHVWSTLCKRKLVFGEILSFDELHVHVSYMYVVSYVDITRRHNHGIVVYFAILLCGWLAPQIYGLQFCVRSCSGLKYTTYFGSSGFETFSHYCGQLTISPQLSKSHRESKLQLSSRGRRVHSSLMGHQVIKRRQLVHARSDVALGRLWPVQLDRHTVWHSRETSHRF